MEENSSKGKGRTSVTCPFAGHTITVGYHNPQKLDASQYAITGVSANGKAVAVEQISSAAVRLSRKSIPKDTILTVTLGVMSKDKSG